jgi:hypothetical protein
MVDEKDPTKPLLDDEARAEAIPSLKDELNYLSRLSGLGARDETFNNEFYGINHRGFNSPIPMNTDGHGLVFFTRPRLNLSYDNLAMIRTLTPLLTSEEKSYQRAIRAYLDPEAYFDTKYVNQVKTPLVDRHNPFIPLLTNNILSLSGWPDNTLQSYTSTEGVMKEQWSMVDDSLRFLGTFDLQATFRNIAGDPITLLFQTWLTYMSAVYLGTIMPYPDMIVENEIDYQTRIYRLVLDPSKRYVQKIAACAAAYPTATSLGTSFNFSKDDVYQTDSKQISIPLRCIGAEYQDPILIREFNTIVQLFNPNMRDDKRDTEMVRLKPREFNFFNHYGYPLINPLDSELEWWVFKKDYADIKKFEEYNPEDWDLNNPQNYSRFNKSY